jgi:hypothetical protein
MSNQNFSEKNNALIQQFQDFFTVWHWFSLIVGLKTLPDKGLTENTKLKEFFPS